MKSWLISGGAGFIGTNFLHLIRNLSDIRIIIVDSLTYAGNLENLKGIINLPHVEFKKLDIREYDHILGIFKKYRFSRVLHLAAESHVDRSILGARPFIQTNIEGTFNLLEAARKTWSNPDDKLFVHVSTDEVFGSLGKDEKPFGKTSPYRPNSPYSASKAASDHLARAWHQTYGVPVTVTHCSNNYGPWQFPEKLFPLVILNAIEGKELPVYGDGLQVRDWLYVQDHCEALMKILEQGKPGERYFIGGNNEKTNLEIIHILCDTVDSLQKRPIGHSRKLIKHISDRPGHDRRYAIDSDKINKDLGWKPRFEFNEKIKDVVLWYMENKNWADSIRSGDYMKYYENQYKGR